MVGPPTFDLFHSSCTLPSIFKLKRSSCARSTPSLARSSWMCASATSGSTFIATCTASASVSRRGAAVATLAVEVAASVMSRKLSRIAILRLGLVADDDAVLEAHHAMGVRRDVGIVGHEHHRHALTVQLDEQLH